MTDDRRFEYGQPRTRLSDGRTGRPPPWPMIAGIILLVILTVVLALLVLGGGREPGASPEPSPSIATSADPSVTPSPSASAPIPTASAEAEPSIAPDGLALDIIVVTTVDGLSVRAAPGTGAERLGSLANGAPSYVVGGPVDADGYRWYLLSALGLPPFSGCIGPFESDPYNCPIWFGWAAAAGPDGSAWLEAQPQECAKAPFDFEEIVIGVTDLMRLACFGADPFTFRAWWPVADDSEPDGACVAEDAPSGWLLCQQLNDILVVIDDSEASDGVGLSVTVNPGSGVSMPGRGTWVELTVHLDDPAAPSCGEDAVGAMAEERTPEQWVLFCRSQMVVESVAQVDGP